MIALFSGQIGLSMFQERAYALVSVATHSRVPRSLVHAAGFSVDLISPLDDRVVEAVESRALHDTTDSDEGEQQRHKGEVAHL